MNIFTHYTNIDYILNNEDFNQSLDITLEEFEKRQPSCPTQNSGRAITTCSDDSVLFGVKNSILLKPWLDNTLSAYYALRNVISFDYDIYRAWCNRIYYGCTGVPHNHYHSDKGLVVVLYYQIPENSSKYVLIHEDVERSSYKDYDPDNLSFIDVKSGLAVCHSSKYYHAVTEHKSYDPRTVFIFDLECKNLKYDTTR